MSVDSQLPIAFSVAGAPLALGAGADAAQSTHSAANRTRERAAVERAEQAAGIAQPDGEEMRSGDRDGDGRQPWIWQQPARAGNNQRMTPIASPRPLDNNACGQLIDLSG